MNEMDHLCDCVCLAFTQAINELVVINPRFPSFLSRLLFRSGKLAYLLNSLDNLLCSENASHPPARKHRVEPVFDNGHAAETILSFFRQMSPESILNFACLIVNEPRDECLLMCLLSDVGVFHPADKLTNKLLFVEASEQFVKFMS
jgi:hypothetical protein